MIQHTLDTEHAILYLRPRSSLEKSDFAALARTIDPYIEKTGGLSGLVIEVGSFPGWESLGALVAHLQFVRDHHQKVRKIAVVTDSPLGKLAQQLGSHFLAAEIRQFPAGGRDAATRWITGATA